MFTFMVPSLHTIILVIFLSTVGAINETCRIVITFETSNDANNIHIDGLPENVRLLKKYGRRLVLDLGRPADIGFDRLFYETLFKNVQAVEADLLVGLEELPALQSELQQTGSQDNPDGGGNVLDLAGQTPLWNLMDSEQYSVHVQGLWKMSNSTPDFVVAVIDTGIAQIASPQILNYINGYDFISDEWLALDNNTRDADATDPGDGGETCPTSSWHGTKVASILAARHDNAWGMKGIAQNCSLLSIRALGQCRMGYASDVADSIVWAAGGSIQGVLQNARPAEIIALSLTGQGTCPDYLQSAVTHAIELGSVIIAAAGNSNQNASGYFPANCKGVLSVAASTRDGKLASYSNWGESVALSAPGGDSVNAIMTLSVDEQKADLMVFFGSGTSFAVPHVAGVVALLANNRNNSWSDVWGRYMNIARFKVNVTCNEAHCAGPQLDSVKLVMQSFPDGRFVFASAASCPDNQYTLNRTDPACYKCPAGKFRSIPSLDSSEGYAAPWAPMQFDYQGNTWSYANRMYGGYGPYWPVYNSNTYQGGFSCAYFVATKYYAYYATPSVDASGCPLGGGGFIPWTSLETTILSASNILWCKNCLPSFTCPTGTYTSFTCENGNPAECKSCPVGTFNSATNQSICTACPVGTYQSNQGRTSQAACLACANNTFNGQLGQSSCSTCASATYTSGQGASACSKCPAGSFMNISDPTKPCLFCNNGTTSDTGGSSCSSCPAAKYTPAAGAPACISCSSGFYMNVSDATKPCYACSIGKVSNTEGSSCTLCSSGQFNSMPAQSACINCPSGQFNSFEGQTACLICAKGSISSASGQTQCILCDAGTFVASDGQTTCFNCQPASYSRVGATECTSKTFAERLRDNTSPGVIVGLSAYIMVIVAFLCVVGPSIPQMVETWQPPHK